MGTFWKILIIAIVIILAYFIWKGYKGNGKKTTKCYHYNTNGTFSEVPCNTPGATSTPPPPTSNVKTVDSYINQWIKAKHDGTRLYDDNLDVVATYNAGEDIGRLGDRSTGSFCCHGNDNFYKILETPYDSRFCQCEPVMSEESLKEILGI